MFQATAVALVSLVVAVSSQDTVARCGPWYSDQACPFNANGLGGQLYCTKFGYCSSSASDDGNAVYVQMDGNCVEQTDMNSYCNSQLVGATCSYAEKRCQITGLDAKKYDGLSASSTTSSTTSSGTTTTSTSTSDSTSSSSSRKVNPLLYLTTLVTVLVAAANI